MSDSIKFGMVYAGVMLGVFVILVLVPGLKAQGARREALAVCACPPFFTEHGIRRPE